MASIEQGTIKGMLQALEHMLDTVDRTSGVAGHLLNAQKAGTSLAPSVITHYEQQLEALGRQRAQMRDVIARWSTLLEEGIDGPAPVELHRDMMAIQQIECGTWERSLRSWTHSRDWCFFTIPKGTIPSL